VRQVENLDFRLEDNQSFELPMIQVDIFVCCANLIAPFPGLVSWD
jgi:hypothetical protein